MTTSLMVYCNCGKKADYKIQLPRFYKGPIVLKDFGPWASDYRLDTTYLCKECEEKLLSGWDKIIIVKGVYDD